MSRFSTMRPPARRHPEPKVPRTHLGRTASNRFCHAPLPPAQVAPHLLTRHQQPPKHLEGRCRWTAAAPRVPPTVSSPGRSVPVAQPAAGSAPHNATPAWQHSLNGACQPRWALLNGHRELSPGGEENRALHGVAALRRPPLIVRAHAAVGLAVLARGMHATEQPLCAATTTEGLRSIAALRRLRALHRDGCRPRSVRRSMGLWAVLRVSSRPRALRCCRRWRTCGKRRSPGSRGGRRGVCHAGRRHRRPDESADVGPLFPPGQASLRPGARAAQHRFAQAA